MHHFPSSSPSPNFDPQALRERFNPEGSLTRQVQQRCLEIWQAFDAICRKHNIPYWLSSGTMLGAVRHGGFIPWDDDLDIDVLRSDYLKLLEILPRELPEQFRLQTHDTDSGYFFCYAKIRDTRSYLEEQVDLNRVYKYHGVFIDIFPYEKMPPVLRFIGEWSFKPTYKILQLSFINDRFLLAFATGLYFFNQQILFPLLRFLARFSKRKLLNYSLGIPFDNAIHLHEAFPQKQVPFEDVTAPIPHDAHAYLQRVYGNYMQLPPLDRLQTHIKSVRLDE